MMSNLLSVCLESLCLSVGLRMCVLTENAVFLISLGGYPFDKKSDSNSKIYFGFL